MKYAMQQRKKIMLTLAMSFALIGSLAFIVIKDTTEFFIQKQAEDVASIVGTFAKTARSVYAQDVISKLKRDGFGAVVDSNVHKGYVPIPAQFLKLLGKSTADNTADLFQYRPVSRWNIEPTQGLSTDFLLWAWPQLEAQDIEAPTAPIDWQPVFRIEKDGEANVMRYLTADPATSESCVACHNAYEHSPDVIKMRERAGVPAGKQWEQHQLLGALEITIPLNVIEARAPEQLNRATMWILVMLTGVLVLIGIVYFFNTQLHRSIENLSWQANHDSLTELVNRRSFERTAKLMWKLAIQENKQHSLLLMDLDGFKSINDTYGHQAGDEVLKAVAKEIIKDRRVNDVMARLGGDEFAVLLPTCPVECALPFAEKIHQNIENIRINWQGNELKIGVSIGVAAIDSHSPSLQKVIEMADAASYIAKSRISIKSFFINKIYSD